MRKKRPSFIYRKRAAWRRLRRLWFPSYAEVQFVRIMHGRVWFSTMLLRDYHTGHPLTIMSLGPVLKAERVRREIRTGALYADFMSVTPYSKRAVLVDGRRWHSDVALEQERDEYYARFNVTVLHVAAVDLWKEPNRTHDRVLKFLAGR